MAQQPVTNVQNNFSQGLKTEFTGLNFPENAATDTDNCVYSINGEVSRRRGIDFETNYTLRTPIPRDGFAIATYKWNNVGGDGTTQLVVKQIGHILYFYNASAATATDPLSDQLIVTTVINLQDFQPLGAASIDDIECQFTDGNGYLFVFHPNMEPIYCSYTPGAVVGHPITLQIRDTLGLLEPGISAQDRPLSLSDLHNYNLRNQGWIHAPGWATTSTSTVLAGLGSKTFTVAAGLPITLGQVAKIYNTPQGDSVILQGTVTAYSGTSLTVNVTYQTLGGTYNEWTILSVNASLLDGWHTALGNWPSNGDIWWRFKDPTTGLFDPAGTQAGVTVNAGPAPKGRFILNTFNQDRTNVSGVSIDTLTTTKRPKTGTWFQGRVWYSGVDASAPASGDLQYYTWTENIYFSRTVEDASHFGQCYQNNDPTAEDFFDLLPTDGGTIKIQGAGSIYKLFPVQNGLIVFAQNGVWFITGSQGIGFQANDYTVTKLSSVQTLSGTSFVDVQGYPMYWNEEGIYYVSPGERGVLDINNIVLNNISSYYADIPLDSRENARGTYNPINFTVSWLFRTAPSTNVTERYQFDKVLNYNLANKAFYPYSIAPGSAPTLHSILYIDSPGVAVPPAIKYLVSTDSSTFTFAEEIDETNWKDFHSYDGSGYDYTSYFVTGYNIHGQGQHYWNPTYVYMYSRNPVYNAYKIQGIWNFAITPSSGLFSTIQNTSVQSIENFNPNKGIIIRRHKIRGRGLVLQYKVASVTGTPFYIIGWSVQERQNASS